MAAASQQKTKFIHSFIVAYWNDMKFIIYPPPKYYYYYYYFSKKKIFFSLSMPDDDDVMVKTYIFPFFSQSFKICVILFNEI